MISSKNIEKSDILMRALIFGVRILLGLGLAVVLSMVCLGIAWGLFIFSGASSRNTLLIMSMAGAGLGAGIGAYVAWLKLDRSSWAFFFIAILMAVAGGVLGGMAGYQYGANREIECCAEPQTAPFTYTAFGATLLANAAMYLAVVGSVVLRMFRAGRQRSIPP